MTTSNTDERLITKKDLLHSACNIGALGMEYSWNYPRQMHLAFCLMINPMLKKIYADDPEGYAEALTRHVAFFNITPQLAPFVGGIAVSMEERVAKGELEGAAVDSVKAALMGPLSGIGDSIFLGCIRVIAVAVGISLASTGNIMGPIAYFLIYNIPAFLVNDFGWHHAWYVRLICYLDLLLAVEKESQSNVAHSWHDDSWCCWCLFWFLRIIYACKMHRKAVTYEYTYVY